MAVSISVLVIIVIGFAVMAIIFHGISVVKHSIISLTELQMNINNAAYEMEINVTETGMAVLKYLDTGDQRYRQLVMDDAADFSRFHGHYAQMAGTAGDQALASELESLFVQFLQLGENLMNTKDDQEVLYLGLSKYCKGLVQPLDEQFESGSLRNLGVNWPGQKYELLYFSNNIVEICSSLGSYLRTRQVHYRAHIVDRADNFRDRLARYEQSERNQIEYAWYDELKHRFDETIVYTEDILAKNDAMEYGTLEFLRLRHEMDDILDEGIQAFAAREVANGVAASEGATSRVLGLAISLIPALVVCSIISAIMMLRALRRPMQQIRKRAKAIASGDFRDRLVVRRGDEFEGLARDFNSILERLTATTVSRNQLEAKQDELQKLNVLLHKEVAERARATKAFQALSHKLVHAQEDERHRIARELHDEIGQALTAIKISLESIDGNAEVGHIQELTHAIGIVGQLLHVVRALSLQLRPSVLDDLGLVAALRWLINQQAQLSRIKVKLQTDSTLPPRMSSDTDITCFRIAQESLTNIARHGQAHQVTVSLTVRDESLILLICDDGIGFDVAAAKLKAAGGNSMGLLSMQERAVVVGGTLNIESSPSGGTCIEACLPIMQG